MSGTNGVLYFGTAAKKLGRSKFGNKRCEYNGEKFDSKRELARYQDLELLQKAGEISDLKRQVPFLLTCDGKPLRYQSGRQVTYVADFTYWDARKGQRVIEDSKGFRDPVFKLKRALMEANGHAILET